MTMVATALIMGLAGSLHCLGMCSPLAMAVTNLRSPFFINRVVYNGGRILTYGLLGAFASSFGSLFRLSGMQNLLTITLGGVLLVTGLVGSKHIRIPVVTSIIHHTTMYIKNMFSRFLKQKTILSVTLMGMLNGLLPCGLTYLALTYCLTVGHGWNGFFFMLIFGAGTLPAMLGFTSILQSLIHRFNISLRNFSTVTMIALGTLLITRSIYVHQHESTNRQQTETIVTCSDEK